MKRIVLFGLALLGLWTQQASGQGLPLIRPPYLQPGDTVALVAISSKTDSLQTEHYARCIDIVRGWGLHVHLADYLFAQEGGWFPAPDSVRGADLQQMIDDDAVRAILFFRGGYGAVRALDYVDLASLQRHPKWLAGFSDLTAVHYALRQVGVESIHGAMPSLFRVDSIERDTSALSLRDALFGQIAGYAVAPHPLNRPGTVRGRLTGGNLSVINSLNGTELDDVSGEPTVLLLEEVGESIHHVDRMLQTLARSGRLASVQGIVVGQFTDIRGEKKWGASVYELIRSYADRWQVPALFGFPAGHGQPNRSLYMGREVELVVTEAGGELRFL